MAVEFDGGVVMGADSRTTRGYVVKFAKLVDINYHEIKTLNWIIIVKAIIAILSVVKFMIDYLEKKLYVPWVVSLAVVHVYL